MKKKRSLASCIQEFWPATILTPIFVIGEVAFDVLIPLMTGKLLDEGVKAGSMHHIAAYGLTVVGMAVLALICGGLNVLLAKWLPAASVYLKWLGAAYMLYLAFGMVRSGLKPAGDDQRSGEGSFQSGILLQVLNVKSWVAALSIFPCTSSPLPPPSATCCWRHWPSPFSARWRACCGSAAARPYSASTAASACR